MTVALPDLSAAKTVAAVTLELEPLGSRVVTPVVVCMWNWLCEMLTLLEGVSVVYE